jgi:conjugal transfer pilus assembly protein TrbC
VTTHFALETIAQGHGPGAPVAKTALANLERTP